MKAWVKKLSGVLFASLLTVMLNGKAYANNEAPPADENIPVIEEPAQVSQAPKAVVTEVKEAPASENKAAAENKAATDAPKQEAAAEAPKAAVTEVKEAPAKEEPIKEAPAKEEPAKQEPAKEEPVKQEPVKEEPKQEESAKEEPVKEEAKKEEPVKQEPVQEQPAKEEPVTEEPVKQEEAAKEEPIKEEPKKEEPEKEKPVKEESKQEEPVKEEPVKEEPVKPESVTNTVDSGALETVKINAASPKKLGSAAPMLAAASSPDNNDNDDPEDSSAPESRSVSSQTNQIIVTDDGTFILNNHTGTETLCTESGEVSIMAAGFNTVGSITSTGDVNITGTGIMLIDKLVGNLVLNTFPNVYENSTVANGSVAVFVKQTDGTYLMNNGSVPGILDEEYNIEGYKLVIPDGSSLNLIGTGAKQTDDGVEYYHGTDHQYQLQSSYEWDEQEELQKVSEGVGRLTIGSNAELIVQQGGSVQMQNLKSYTGYGSMIYPELNIRDGGKITLNGSINGGGKVEISGTNVVSGSGTLSASQVKIDRPAAVSQANVTLSSIILRLNGSGEYKDLKINSSRVYPQSGVSVTGLDSSGSCTFILPNVFDLDIRNMNGDISFIQRTYYQSTDLDDVPRDVLFFYGETDYGDSIVHKISGDINGSGKLIFKSGIYELRFTKGSGVSVSNDYAAHIYDYSNATDFDVNPLHVAPNDLTDGIAQYGGCIPVRASMIFEESDVVSYADSNIDQGTGVKTLHFLGNKDLLANNGYPVDEIACICLEDKNNTEYISYDSSYLKELIESNVPSAISYPWNGGQINNPCLGIIVEFIYKSNGSIRTEYVDVDSLDDSIYDLDLCMIRIAYVYNHEGIAGGGDALQTSTSHTGTGILGGFNGSVYVPPQDPPGNDDSNSNSNNNENNNQNNNENNNQNNNENNNQNNNENNNENNNQNNNENNNQNNNENNNQNNNENNNQNNSENNNQSSNENNNENTNTNDNSNINTNENTNTNTDVTENTNTNTNENTNNNTGTPIQAPVVTQNEAAPVEAPIWIEVIPEEPAAAPKGTSTASGSSTAAPATSATEAPASVETTYELHAAQGEKTLDQLGGSVTVTMKYTPPAEIRTKPLYVVFLNDDGSLTAVKATYSILNKQLKFTTDQIGKFMIVGFDFKGDMYEADGVTFTKDFYEALAKLDVLQNLLEEDGN